MYALNFSKLQCVCKKCWIIVKIISLFNYHVKMSVKWYENSTASQRSEFAHQNNTIDLELIATISAQFYYHPRSQAQFVLRWVVLVHCMSTTNPKLWIYQFLSNFFLNFVNCYVFSVKYTVMAPIFCLCRKMNKKLWGKLRIGGWDVMNKIMVTELQCFEF